MKKLSLLAVILALAVSSTVLAGTQPCVHTGMFGIVGGQTARLSVVNVFPPERNPTLPPYPCMLELMFFDDMGRTLGGSIMVELMPGEAAFHHLMRAEAVMRTQIRAEVMLIGEKKNCDIKTTVEVLNNATGETMFVLLPPIDPE